MNLGNEIGKCINYDSEIVYFTQVGDRIQFLE